MRASTWSWQASCSSTCAIPRGSWRKRAASCVASVPNAYRLKNRLRFAAGRKPEDDPTHLHMFSPDEVRALLAGFEEPQLHFIAGRLVPLHARLFANDIVFSGRKPR
jgi:hypothetical protein